MNDSIALIIPALGMPDLGEMLESMKDNKFDEIIVVIDNTARRYLPDSQKADIEYFKRKYLFVRWFENNGNGMINETINVGFAHSTSEWIWITHEDVLFPQQIKPHPNYRYDLRIKTVIRSLDSGLYPRDKQSIMMHYYQIPNGLDTRMFAHLENDNYVSDIGGGGGCTGITTVLHRSVIERIGKDNDCVGFDLKYCTYYDTQVAADSCNNHWTGVAIHDAPAILHKVSAAGRFTNNCNNFEPEPKWKNIGENADAYRRHIDELYLRRSRV